MAEQILTLAAARFDAQTNSANWSYSGQSSFQIAEGLRASTSSYFDTLSISRTQIVLRIRNTLSGIDSVRRDLTAEFENNGSIQIDAEGESLLVPIGGLDTVEPYIFNITDADDLANMDAFVDALNGEADGTVEGTLTLRDFTPAPPSFTDDTGDAISGTVGEAIASVVVPEADGAPPPTYAAVGALPAGVSFDPDTRVLSFDEDAIVAGSGTITIRATNSAGMDDWTADYTFIAPLDAAFTGGLTGTLSPGVALGQAPDLGTAITDTQVTSTPIALSDTYGFDETIEFTVTWDGPVDVTGNPRFPLNFGQSPSGGPEYADYAGGTGTANITFEWVVSATDEDTNGVFFYGDTDSQNRGDIDLNGGTIRNGGTQIDADLTTLNRGTKGDHKVDGSLSPPALAANATFDGDLAGDLAPGVALGDAPDLVTGAAFDGELDGELSAGLALGDAPILPVALDAPFTGELAGTLAPGVALGGAPMALAAAFSGALAGDLAAGVGLGDRPMAGRVFDLGENPFLGQAQWEGSYLIDPALVVGGATAWLRRIDEVSGSCRIDIASTPGGSFAGAGPELVPQWETLADAIVFSADGGGITLKGPNHPDNIFRDSTEPYFWTPDNATAFRDWFNSEPRNVVVTFNGPVSLAADAAFDGDIAGDLAAGVALGDAPDLAVAAAFDGDLDGDLAAGVALGPAALVLDSFNRVGREIDALALITANVVPRGNQNTLYADANRGGTDSVDDGELGLDAGETLITRIEFIPGSNQVRLNDNDLPVPLNLETYFAAVGGISPRFVTFQTAAGEVSTNVVAAVSDGFARIDFSGQPNLSVLQDIATGTPFLFAVWRIRPSLDVGVAFTGELDGTLSAGVALLPVLTLGTAFTGELDGTLSPGVALGVAPPIALPAVSFTGELDGTLSAQISRGPPPPLVIPAVAFTGGLDGTLSGGVIVIDLADLLDQIGRPIGFEVTPGDGYLDLDFDSPVRGDQSNITYEVQIDGGAWVPLAQYLRQ